MDSGNGDSWRWKAGEYSTAYINHMQVIERESKPGNPIGFAPPHPYRHSRQRQGPFPPQVAARQRI